MRRKAAIDLTDADKKLFKDVSKEIPKLRSFFKQGMDSFEKVSSAASLKSLNSAVKGGKELNPSQAFKNLIRQDNPKLLKDARAVLGDKVYEPLRERASGEWLRRAMRESGSTLDSTKKFSGSKLKEKIDSLGGTADELFGSKISEVRRLADQMDSLSLTRVDQSVIDNYLNAGGDETGVNLLRNIKDAMQEKAQFDKAALARKLRAGSLMPDEAADLLASPSVKGNDITKLSKFFENSPQEMAEIRSYYMQNLIGDFESSFMTDKKSFRALADRLVKAKNSGKLDAIFPKEEADAIELFGKNMQILGKSAEGGDLVAANIAANPLENIGTIARLGLVGQVLSTGPFYTSFAAKYGKESAKESTKAGKMRVFLNILNQTSQSFAKQSTARGAYGLGSTASNEANFQAERIKNSIMPSTKPVRRTSVPIPEVSPVMDIPSMPNSSQSSIRDRVRDDPALAASLLGGLDNIGFV